MVSKTQDAAPRHSVLHWLHKSTAGRGDVTTSPHTATLTPHGDEGGVSEVIDNLSLMIWSTRRTSTSLPSEEARGSGAKYASPSDPPDTISNNVQLRLSIKDRVARLVCLERGGVTLETIQSADISQLERYPAAGMPPPHDSLQFVVLHSAIDGATDGDRGKLWTLTAVTWATMAIGCVDNAVQQRVYRALQVLRVLPTTTGVTRGPIVHHVDAAAARMVEDALLLQDRARRLLISSGVPPPPPVFLSNDRSSPVNRRLRAAPTSANFHLVNSPSPLTSQRAPHASVRLSAVPAASPGRSVVDGLQPHTYLPATSHDMVASQFEELVDTPSSSEGDEDPDGDSETASDANRETLSPGGRSMDSEYMPAVAALSDTASVSSGEAEDTESISKREFVRRIFSEPFASAKHHVERVLGGMGPPAHTTSLAVPQSTPDLSESLMRRTHAQDNELRPVGSPGKAKKSRSPERKPNQQIPINRIPSHSVTSTSPSLTSMSRARLGLPESSQRVPAQFHPLQSSQFELLVSSPTSPTTPSQGGVFLAPPKAARYRHDHAWQAAAGLPVLHHQATAVQKAMETYIDSMRTAVTRPTQQQEVSEPNEAPQGNLRGDQPETDPNTDIVVFKADDEHHPTQVAETNQGVAEPTGAAIDAQPASIREHATSPPVAVVNPESVVPIALRPVPLPVPSVAIPVVSPSDMISLPPPVQGPGMHRSSAVASPRRVSKSRTPNGDGYRSDTSSVDFQVEDDASPPPPPPLRLTALPPKRAPVAQAIRARPLELHPQRNTSPRMTASAYVLEGHMPPADREASPPSPQRVSRRFSNPTQLAAVEQPPKLASSRFQAPGFAYTTAADAVPTRSLPLKRADTKDSGVRETRGRSSSPRAPAAVATVAERSSPKRSVSGRSRTAATDKRVKDEAAARKSVSPGERRCKWCKNVAPENHDDRCSHRKIKCKRCGTIIELKDKITHVCSTGSQSTEQAK